MSTNGPHIEGAPRPLHCMEIWGGAGATDAAASTPGLDAWAYCQPHEGASDGGDVHYVSLCGGGLITRLMVADIAGHGAAVGPFARSLRALMRRNINTKSQTRLVRALNRQFAAQAESGRFATAVVATYLAGRGRLTVCNAGHPRPLWYRADRDAWEILDRRAGEPAPEPGASLNLPLGLDDDTAYDQFSARLAPGDLVLVYTDALTEAADPSGRLLGEPGLLALARTLDPRDPARLGPALLDAIARHRAGHPADDDVTLLTLHHNAARPRRLSVAEKLDVYAKVFGLRAV